MSRTTVGSFTLLESWQRWNAKRSPKLKHLDIQILIYLVLTASFLLQGCSKTAIFLQGNSVLGDRDECERKFVQTTILDISGAFFLCTFSWNGFNCSSIVLQLFRGFFLICVKKMRQNFSSSLTKVCFLLQKFSVDFLAEKYYRNHQFFNSDHSYHVFGWGFLHLDLQLAKQSMCLMMRLCLITC